ncbi:MAG: YIP1 family protein [Clostridia bacterium]|nr:YIP1 family protein [Clostridia bacterium]
MKKIISVLLIVLSLSMIIPMAVLSTSAASAYQTYTYSIEGTALYSPDAYSADISLTSKDLGLDKDLNKPNDLVTDNDGNVYIADSGNNRIVIFNRNYEYQGSLENFVIEGIDSTFKNPKGVFVTDTSIWVCDTGNLRLLEFDKETMSFKKKIDAPDSQLFGDSKKFSPIAMAVDQYGRMYVVSDASNEGIIVMNSNGDFVGFIGSQAVALSAWEIIWRNFQSAEQREQQSSTVTTTYNNITITSDGFVYVTTSSIAESSVSGAISSKAKDGTYMPVKLLNPAGDEIMRRNGFWPPAGEIDIFGVIDPEAEVSGVSQIVDVAAGPEKTWSIIDTKRQKIYTYDYNGNLLFAFGDTGTLLGSIKNIKAIAYQGDKMLILDAGANCLVVYNRTEYGDMLINAIAAENSLDFDYAIECWEKVLQRNSNFDAAYVGIGNALYRSAKYEEAMEYYEAAYDTENWSEAYKMVRKEWMSKWLIPMVIVLIAILVLVIKFFAWAAKVNKRVSTDGKARKTYGQELLYGFYVIFHPFDGFYDLKHEHRGSVRASLTFIGIAILTMFYKGIGQGYVLNPTGEATTIWAQALAVLIPLVLFIVANWCLTTLFEGEGSFKDILIASGYALVPMPLLMIPATIASNWVTSTEAAIVSMLSVIALIWVFMLLFFGTMVTHDYSLGKNFITILGTIVAMAFIVFLVLLFSMLLTKMVGLVTNIVTEIQYRV